MKPIKRMTKEEQILFRAKRLEVLNAKMDRIRLFVLKIGKCKRSAYEMRVVKRAINFQKNKLERLRRVGV